MARIDDRDPFAVLGVAPDAPMADIEATYRILLRAHHPDLHHGGGPDAVRRAEQRTKQINDAMHRIRRGPEPDAPPAAPPWGTTGRHRHRPPTSVPCPFCALSFNRLEEFTVHLDAAHQMHQKQFGHSSRSTGIGQTLSKIRFIPAWLVAATVWFMILAHAPWWSTIPLLVLLLCVLWAQGSAAARHHRLR